MAQIILTNHLKERAGHRGIGLSDIDKTIRFPDQVIKSKQGFSKKHLKTFVGYRITVALKQRGNDWIAISAWQTPLSAHSSKSNGNRSFLEKTIHSLLLKIEEVFSRRFK